MLASFLSLLLLAPTQLEDYIVKEGDSCASISRRRFGARKHYPIIHVYNDLGPMPHRLKPGTVLRLPVRVDGGPDAIVTQTERVVQARAPKQPSWSRAQEGLDLFRGWRVNTLDKAYAEVTFRDASRIHLRQNTLVIIYGNSSSNVRRRTTTAKLDRGALRANLAALAGKPSLAVETPSAATTVQGAALVKVDDAGTSRVANHGDADVVVRSKTKRRRRVRVGRGMGSKVKTGSEPSPPKPLPPTPRWAADSPTRFVVPAGGGGSVRGQWSKVDAATSYRVELGRGIEGGFTSTTVVVPGNVTRFEAHNLAPGPYFAIVSAVDDDEFESVPSRMHKADVVEAKLVGAGGGPVAVPALERDGPAPQPIPVLLGASVAAPDGMRCAFGSDEVGPTARVSAEGEQRLRCLDGKDQPVPGFAVHAHGLTIAPAAPFTDGVTLEAGETIAVGLELDSPAGVPTDLQAGASEGLTVSKMERTDAGVALKLSADDAAPAKGEVRLFVGETELGALDVEVTKGGRPQRAADEPLPWIKRWAPTPHLVELGVFGGVFAPNRRLELFESDPAAPEFGFKPFAPVSGVVGLRASYMPMRFFGVGVDGAVMPTQAGGDPALLWAFRGHAIGQLGLWSVTPYVLAGAGALAVSSPPSTVGSDVDAAFHFGGGLKLFLSRRVMLQLEVRDTIAGGAGIGSGVTHSLEGTLGLGLTLNRGRRTQ